MPLLDHHCPLLPLPDTHNLTQSWHFFNSLYSPFVWLALCTYMYVQKSTRAVSIHNNAQRAGCQQISLTDSKMLEQVTDSPRHRHNLTLVSSIWEALPISLFRGPNGLNKLLEMSVEYPFNLLGKSAMAFIMGQSWCVCLKSWYTQ